MRSGVLGERQAIDLETAALGGTQPVERSDALMSLIFDGIDQSGRHVAPVFYRCDVTSPYLFTHLSSSVTNHFGYHPDELLGRPKNALEGHCQPEDAHVLERLPRLFARGVHVGESRLRHRDGRVLRFRDEMRLLCDQDGAPLQIAGCLTALEP